MMIIIIIIATAGWTNCQKILCCRPCKGEWTLCMDPFVLDTSNFGIADLLMNSASEIIPSLSVSVCSNSSRMTSPVMCSNSCGCRNVTYSSRHSLPSLSTSAYSHRCLLFLSSSLYSLVLTSSFESASNSKTARKDISHPPFPPLFHRALCHLA